MPFKAIGQILHLYIFSEPRGAFVLASNVCFNKWIYESKILHMKKKISLQYGMKCFGAHAVTDFGKNVLSFIYT